MNSEGGRIAQINIARLRRDLEGIAAFNATPDKGCTRFSYSAEDHKARDSGALHDACIMTAVTEVGMLFVPSIGGRSHVPEEDTSCEDIEKGCNVLLRALLALAN